MSKIIRFSLILAAAISIVSILISSFKLPPSSAKLIKVVQEHIQEPLEHNELNGEAIQKEQVIEDPGKIVYLTFDDGPTAVSNKIIDILAQYDANATFFMLEPAMKRYPEEVIRTVKEGHGVGLHGVTHQLEQFYQSEQSALREMTMAQETLQRIAGVKTNLIRTPYGSIPYLTDSYREVLKLNGFHLWDWNVDSSDWNLENAEYVQNVINQVENISQSGGSPIILMHDRSETALHLASLLDYLKENDYHTKIIDNDLESYHFACHDRCYRLNTK